MIYKNKKGGAKFYYYNNTNLNRLYQHFTGITNMLLCANRTISGLYRSLYR